MKGGDLFNTCSGRDALVFLQCSSERAYLLMATFSKPYSVVACSNLCSNRQLRGDCALSLHKRIGQMLLRAFPSMLLWAQTADDLLDWFVPL